MPENLSLNNEPRHISEVIVAAVGMEVDGNQTREQHRRDLESEIAGLTAEIADVQTDMRLTRDPNLPATLDALTEASMLAQRGLQNLQVENPDTDEPE